jgi:hypothetical protein
MRSLSMQQQLPSGYPSSSDANSRLLARIYWITLCCQRPLATRTLRARLPTKLQSESEATTPGEFQSFVLLTGGRYLLSRTSEGFLQLWDLGIPGELGDTQREQIATIETDDDRGKFL